MLHFLLPLMNRLNKAKPTMHYILVCSAVSIDSFLFSIYLSKVISHETESRMMVRLDISVMRSETNLDLYFCLQTNRHSAQTICSIILDTISCYAYIIIILMFYLVDFAIHNYKD